MTLQGMLGKIIGGTAGFAIGGPLGAILGVMVNLLRPRKRQFRKPVNT